MSTTESRTREEMICQHAAQALWFAAISDNRQIAGSQTPIYVCLERALITSIMAVYGLGQTRATYVRNLVAEYGPDDSLSGTSANGVASYVEYVLAHRGERF